MKKVSLTIAIPALNEEKSLPQLLDSLKIFKPFKDFKFSTLILLSDGSTDKTPKIIKDFKINNIKVVKIIDSKRKGKIYRLNQIFTISKTKYLLIIDADICIQNNTINNLLKSVIKNKAVLTVSHQIPVKPSSIVGNIIYRGYQMWDEIRTSNNKYLDNPQNFYGASSLYEYKFYHYLRIPKKFQDERKFIYYSAKKVGKFVYEKSSIIYYHPVSTYKDLYVQGSRSQGIDNKIKKYFGNDVSKTIGIPAKYKLRILIKYLFYSPIETVLYLVMKYYIKVFRKTDHLTTKGMWAITSSTKNGF